MLATALVLLATSCAADVVAPIALPSPGPFLAMHYDKARRIVDVSIQGVSADFYGGLIASSREDLVHYLVDLPPLLADHVIVGIGQAQNGVLAMQVPVQVPLLVDLKIFAQAVSLEEDGFHASPVASIGLPRD